MLKEVHKDENQHNSHTLQPQHPHSNNVPANSLKETLPNNNLENTIMDSSDKTVLDYLISSEKGEIRNNRKLK